METKEIKVPNIKDVLSAFSSLTNINSNFQNIRTAFSNTLSRDGSSPNSMLAPLDMNGQPIINCPSLVVHDLGGTSVTIGVSAGTVAAGDDSRIVGALQKNANLSDLNSIVQARANLGLGSSATLNSGTSSGNVVTLGSDGKVPSALLPAGSSGSGGSSDSLLKSSNLSDLASVTTARTNLGLGTASLATVGTAVGNLPPIGSDGKLSASILPTTSGGSTTSGGGVFVDDYYGGSNPSETFTSGTYSGQPDYKNSFTRAFAASLVVNLKPKTYYTSGTVNQTLSGQLLRGSGIFQTVLICTDVTVPVVKKGLALVGVGIQDLTVQHPSGTVDGSNRPVFSGSMTSAAHGVDYGNTGSQCFINRVNALWNYDGINCGGTDDGYCNDCIVTTNKNDGAHFVPNGAEGTLIYVNPNVQWNPVRLRSTGNGRYGIHIEGLNMWGGSTYNGQTSTGTFLQCSFGFQDGQGGFKVTGYPNCPVYAARIDGGFGGETYSGNLVEIDSYGGGHVVNPLYLESSNQSGIYLSQNNDDIYIGCPKNGGHRNEAIWTAARLTQVGPTFIANCGQSGTTGRQNAITVASRSDGVVPQVSMTGVSTYRNTGTGQKYGFYAPTTDNHIAVGCNFNGNATAAIQLPAGFSVSRFTGNMPDTANFLFHTAGPSAFLGNINMAADPATPGTPPTLSNPTGSISAAYTAGTLGLFANAILTVSGQATFNADAAFASTAHFTGAAAFASTVNLTGSGTQLYVNSGGISAAYIGATSGLSSNGTLTVAGASNLNGSTYTNYLQSSGNIYSGNTVNCYNLSASNTVSGYNASYTANVAAGGGFYASGASQFSGSLYLVSGAGYYTQGGGHYLDNGTQINVP